MNIQLCWSIIVLIDILNFNIVIFQLS